MINFAAYIFIVQFKVVMRYSVFISNVFKTLFVLFLLLFLVFVLYSVFVVM